MSIDVVIPTYGRAHKLAALVDNIKQASTLVWNITIVYEDDDKPTAGAVAALRDDMVRGIINTKGRTYADCVNLAAEVCDAEWLFTGADDLRFYAGWDVQALRLASLTEAKVIGTNDLWNASVLAGQHSTHSLVAVDYIDNLGATADAIPGKVLHEYHHNFVDPELVQVAAIRGVYAHCHTSLVEHLHPLAGKAEMDATYEHGTSQYQADAALFQERMATFAGLS
jgi:glycosyltransferase involved in cell wall biosynthesis